MQHICGRLEHLGHNWNLIMVSPVKPLDLFIAKFAVVAKLALLTHIFVFVLYVFVENLRTSVRLAINETAIFSSERSCGSAGCYAAQLVLCYDDPKLRSADLLGLVGGVTGHCLQDRKVLHWPGRIV